MLNFVADANLRTLVQVDTLLIMGLMSMTGSTTLLRLSRKVYATPEDYARRAAPADAACSSPASDEPIARVRRIHQNHLENVLPFLVLSALFVLTDPDHCLFASLLWAYLALRALYTFFYARSMQPHRTIAFCSGILIQISIAVLTLIATFSGAAQIP